MRHTTAFLSHVLYIANNKEDSYNEFENILIVLGISSFLLRLVHKHQLHCHEIQNIQHTCFEPEQSSQFVCRERESLIITC
jgi:hypothetical protein